MSMTFVLLLCVSLPTDTSALKIVDFRVPDTAYAGDSVRLFCNYVLGNDVLYTLKWYKNEKVKPLDGPYR